MKKPPKAALDPQTQIANLTADLRAEYHLRHAAEHRQREVEKELARAVVTIEALSRLLVKERDDRDIPF
ncbi:hypothetical protein [Bosea sp. MMO-172]|uniref:hypothetical protein n=1 Tax=Bosea sp. MMO-172 TaxID=3127885 RepID=UPI00301AF9B4